MTPYDLLRGYGYARLRGAIATPIAAAAADLLGFYDGEPRHLALEARASALHDADPKAFHRWCLAAARTPAVLRVLDAPVVADLATRVLGPRWYLADASAFFNRRDVTRLQYDWHVERDYYPRGGEVLTLWFPFVHEVGVHNGTMELASGSHRLDLRGVRERVPGGLDQMRLDEAAFAGCPREAVELPVGDAVAFLAGTAHRTLPNPSETPRLSMILRLGDRRAYLDGGWER